MTQNKEMNKTQSLISGGISGCIARTLTSPIEVIKILKQTGNHSNMSFSQCFNNIYKNEGIKGYFRGNGTYLVRTLPYSAIQFMTFEQTNIILKKNNIFNKDFQYLASGATAGFTSLTTTYPLELIRTRLTIQSRHEQKYTGILNATSQIVKNEGMKGLFKGYGMSCIGFIPYLSINFYTFNYLKDRTNSNGNPIINLVNGSLAGTTAISITYPTDLIRRKLQIDTNTNPKMYDCIKNVYKTQGYRGFYKGYLTGIGKVTPMSGITFMSYEIFKNYFLNN